MFEVGDVLFLERPIAGLPYPTGYYVLCDLTQAAASVALVSNDREGLYAIDNRYAISVEDMLAFTCTGEKARLTKF